MEEANILRKGDIRFGKISFSRIELIDLLKAWLAISFAFANVLATAFSQIPVTFIISSLTVGIGFIFHELGHKVLAQRYGAWAEFRAWNQMLLLAVLFSFIGFVFAAPGAVMIAGRTIGKSRNGKISAMGPAMNFIMAIVFGIVAFAFTTGIGHIIGRYGFIINAWLGSFNLIPFGFFDGKKIFEWSKAAYFILVSVGIGMIMSGYLLFGGL
jgi:Zn-dependent protease